MGGLVTCSSRSTMRRESLSGVVTILTKLGNLNYVLFILQVFQRHVDGSQDFFLYWDDYKQGFGNLTNNFWLGNDKIHSFTNQRRYQLRVDLVNSNGVPYFAKYDFFRINDENDKYDSNLVVIGPKAMQVSLQRYAVLLRDVKVAEDVMLKCKRFLYNC
ncbi:putative ficolin-2-like [Apostichopus japonicus]|uniref:Putative ficolin-2-like n=1 Tax=Stichopus japonicus TaxID=307972 RepID=A0A2G8JW00_STIJA|nr:putative ficolin-2-like [Apostichopus japonicus]